jgi:hypothetical protein
VDTSNLSSLSPPPADFVRCPLTVAIFGTLAGYYVTYAIGLLRWRRRVRLAGAAAEPATAGP